MGSIILLYRFGIWFVEYIIFCINRVITITFYWFTMHIGNSTLQRLNILTTLGGI